MKLRGVLSCLFIVLLCAPFMAQSDRAKAEATVNGKKVSVTYGKPSLRGRDLLGMAQVGTVWRLGRNQATEIESAGSLWVDGKELNAGKYSLWAKKTGDTTWVLAFHPDTGIWGAPPRRTGFVAELPLKMEKASESAEELTITLSEMNGQAHIKIQWGTDVLAGAFGVK